MLVVTRKVGERVLVGDNVVVEIRNVDGKRVSVGVSAPPGVSILREELAARRLAAEAAASKAAS
jgi:carbon storage regulator